MTDPTTTGMLVVDDVVLLLMDDDRASVQVARTSYHTLGGALLTTSPCSVAWRPTAAAA